MKNNPDRTEVIVTIAVAVLLGIIITVEGSRLLAVFSGWLG